MTTLKTRWHLWLVGVLALLWNGFGLTDLVLTFARPDSYLRSAGLNEAQIAYTISLPGWIIGLWALGALSGLTAAVLLLIRKRWAVPLFAISLGAVIINGLYHYGLGNASEIMGTYSWVTNAVVGVICAFFLWYAWNSRRRGVLS